MPLILSGTNGVSGVDGSAGTPSYQGGDSNTGVFFPAADTIAFAEGGAEIARFDSSGNLGIGTSSPSTKLDVNGIATAKQAIIADGANGNIQFGSTSTYNIVGGVDNEGIRYNVPTGMNHQFRTNATERMRITSGGSVGIGTSSPLGKFVVSNGGANGFEINPDEASGAETRINSYNRSTAAFTPIGINASQHYWLTSSTERMRITSGGQVFIGTSSDTGGRVCIQNSANNTNTLKLTNSASGDVSQASLTVVKFDNNNTTSQIFVRFLINNDATGSGQINANGASAVAFGTFSDSRLKENIVDLPSQLENIRSLRPVEFDYKDGSGHQVGFIAQEMQEVYPDVVAPDSNGMLMITGWSKTEARLVKAIQEQQAMIEELKAKVAALETK